MMAKAERLKNRSVRNLLENQFERLKHLLISCDGRNIFMVVCKVFSCRRPAFKYRTNYEEFYHVVF